MTTKGPHRARALCLASVCLIATVVPARAQDTRAGIIIDKQAEKAKIAAPYTPSRFERIMTSLEESFVSPPDGFYPQVGSIPQGGGFSAGVGYRNFFGRQSVFDIRGAYSVKNYFQVETAARRPWDGNGRVVLETKAGYLDAPQVGYYGTGMDGGPRTNFTLRYAYAAGRADIRPTWWTRLHGELGYDRYDTESGEGGHPSIETEYDASITPGLFTKMSFVRAEGRAAIDTRPSPFYTRRGSFLGATLLNYSDTGDGTFGFQRADVEAIQHIPLLRENWVLSLRGRMQSVVQDDDTVPFFLLPSLGSGRTLRAYPTGRFRDRHSILTSAELRWIPNRLSLDMALFYDAGKVTNRRADLDFDNLESDWGIGVRFHSPRATVLRIEGARGSEGWRLVFSTGAAW